MTDQKLALDANLKTILNDTLLKYGRLSIPYLMRKLKCTEQRAKYLVDTFFAS